MLDPAAPEITVSIVSMNNATYLARCLDSLYRHHPDVDLEVIVVFYRTPDDAVREIESRYPHIRAVVSGSETRGYGENQNLGLRQARGKYSVILNDDIVFHDDALRQLRDYHRRNADIGALFPKLLNEDGTVQIAIRGELTPLSYALQAFKLTQLVSRVPALRPWLFDAPNHDSAVPVPADCGTGAFFWVETDVLRRVGYMDERFFLAPDDIDLSKRIAGSGAHMMYVPSVTAIHTGSATLSKVYSKVLPVSTYGVMRFFRTHYGRAAAATATAVTLAASIASTAYWTGKWLRGDRERAPTMLRGNANIGRFLLARPKSMKEMFLKSW